MVSSSSLYEVLPPGSIDQSARIAMHDEELIGLHGLAIFFAQMRNHQANMPIFVVKLDCHMRSLMSCN